MLIVDSVGTSAASGSIVVEVSTRISSEVFKMFFIFSNAVVFNFPIAVSMSPASYSLDSIQRELLTIMIVLLVGLQNL